MSEELKPCPFCGGESRSETYGGTACAVVCQTCGCGTSTMRLDEAGVSLDDEGNVTVRKTAERGA